MGGLHGLNMKKIGSKNQLPSRFLPPFFSLYRGHWPPPPSSLVCPPPSPLRCLTTSCGGSTTFLSSLPTDFFFFFFSLSLPFVRIQPLPFLSSASCRPPMLAGHRRHARWSSPLSFLLLPFILHAVP